jgi:hypothetical protein
LCNFDYGRLWRRKRCGPRAAAHCDANGNFNDRAYTDGDVFLGATAAIAADSTHTNSEVAEASACGAIW